MAAQGRSKYFPARLLICPLSSNQHPLHLKISRDSLKYLCPGTSTDTTIACVSRSHSNALVGSVSTLDSFDPVFVCLQTTRGPLESITSDSEDDSRTLTLGCSKTFLDHYGFSLDDTLHIRAVTTHALSKMVIVATTMASFEWAKSHCFSNALLISACQQSVLVRKGDVLLAPYSDLFNKDVSYHPSFLFDLHVIETEPLNQGVLSIKSEILITCNVNFVPDYLCSTRNIHPLQCNALSIANSQLVYASDFASVLNKPVAHHKQSINSANIDILNISGNDTLNVYKKLKPIVVSSSEEWSRMFPTQCYNSSFDSFTCIGMTKETLQSLGLFDNSFVLLNIEHNNCETMKIQLDENSSETSKRSNSLGSEFNSKPTLGQTDSLSVNTVNILNDQNSDENKRSCSHLAKVNVINKEETSETNDDCIFMTPALWFNVAQQSHSSEVCVTVQKWLGPSPQTITSASRSWSSTVPYATELHVHLVNSPCYTAATSFERMLKQFFKIPRIFQEGDIFTISTKGDPTFYNDSAESSDVRYPVAHFKVNKIVPKVDGCCACMADISHTTLLQIGTVHDFIPVSMENFLNEGSLHPVWHSGKPSGLQRYVHRLVSIVQPHITAHCSDLVASLLLSGDTGCGKSLVVKAVAERLNLHIFKVDCHDLCSETSGAVEAKINAIFHRAKTYSPCILYLMNIHVLGKDRDGVADDARVCSFFHRQVAKSCCGNKTSSVILVAATHSPKLLSSDMMCGFLHQVHIEVPDVADRRDMLNGLLSTVTYSRDVSIDHIAQRTAGMVLGDLAAFIIQTKSAAYKRIIEKCRLGQLELSREEEEDICAAGVCCTSDDFNVALNHLQSMHSDTIGAPKIPNVGWEDIGGLVDVKAAILDTIQLPLQHPELFEAGLRRSGVLLYGPPGTGKTLLAKAVATECSLNFLSVKGPELLNMYVGQSEENVREVFHRARSATPCVIFFDELDSLAPNRGRSGDSGGVMDRVVSQLLAELDGLHKAFDVFVIGATNRPDLLDPALLRPGRFDKLLYLGVSEDSGAQVRILQALTRKFALDKGCDLRVVAEKCPKNLTGADFYALCSDAMLNALKRKIALLDTGVEVDQTCVEVSAVDFEDALHNLVPSVSYAELQHYKQLQSSIASN